MTRRAERRVHRKRALQSPTRTQDLLVVTDHGAVTARTPRSARRSRSGGSARSRSTAATSAASVRSPAGGARSASSLSRDERQVLPAGGFRWSSRPLAALGYSSPRPQAASGRRPAERQAARASARRRRRIRSRRCRCTGASRRDASAASTTWKRSSTWSSTPRSRDRSRRRTPRRGRRSQRDRPRRLADRGPQAQRARRELHRSVPANGRLHGRAAAAAHWLGVQASAAIANARLRRVAEQHALTDDLTGLAIAEGLARRFRPRSTTPSGSGPPLALLLADLETPRRSTTGSGMPGATTRSMRSHRLLSNGIHKIDLAAPIGDDEFAVPPPADGCGGRP